MWYDCLWDYCEWYKTHVVVGKQKKLLWICISPQKSWSLWNSYIYKMQPVAKIAKLDLSQKNFIIRVHIYDIIQGLPDLGLISKKSD